MRRAPEHTGAHTRNITTTTTIMTSLTSTRSANDVISATESAGITDTEPPLVEIIAATAGDITEAEPRMPMPMPNSPSDVFAMDEPRGISPKLDASELGDSSKAPRTADGAPVFSYFWPMDPSLSTGSDPASSGRPLAVVKPGGLCCVLRFMCAATCVDSPTRSRMRFAMALVPVLPVVQVLRCNCDAIPIKIPMLLFGIFAAIGGATRFWYNIPLNPNKQALPGTHTPTSFNGLAGVVTLAMAVRLATLTFAEFDARIEDGGEDCDAILFQNAFLICSVTFVVVPIAIVVAIVTRGKYPERRAAWAAAASADDAKPKQITAKAGDVECGTRVIISPHGGQPPSALATRMIGQQLGSVVLGLRP